MTDYERTTVRETTASDPTVVRTSTGDTYVDPAPAARAVRTTEREYHPAGPSGSSVVQRVVIFLFGILQVALILRIILLLLVANTGNDVVSMILGVTDPFVEPFRGMFDFDRVTADQGSVLDVAAIVALIGWTLVEALVLAAARIFDRREVTTV